MRPPGEKGTSRKNALTCWCVLSSTALKNASKKHFLEPLHPAGRLSHFTPTHIPRVRKSLSPTSPKPGLIMPLASVSLSQPPTHTSTPSATFAAFVRPFSDAMTLMTRIRFTPQSLRVSMAAEAVAPVAMTGSTMMAW